MRTDENCHRPIFMNICRMKNDRAHKSWKYSTFILYWIERTPSPSPPSLGQITTSANNRNTHARIPHIPNNLTWTFLLRIGTTTTTTLTSKWTRTKSTTLGEIGPARVGILQAFRSIHHPAHHPNRLHPIIILDHPWCDNITAIWCQPLNPV